MYCTCIHLNIRVYRHTQDPSTRQRVLLKRRKETQLPNSVIGGRVMADTWSYETVAYESLEMQQ